ncbi:MAG: class I SAM-dependent rRNA methyltransferase [Cyclobacteriaceae bacterium]
MLLTVIIFYLIATMNHYPEITLKKGKEISVQRQHHWIFSGAVEDKPENLQEGEIVKVLDFQKRFLAIGFYAAGSIMVRMISFVEVPIRVEFWAEKIQIALNLRKETLFLESAETNAYRLVHGEGDQLPGLIIDIYKHTAIIQAHHLGIHLQTTQIAEALIKVYGKGLEGVYNKSAATLHSNNSNHEGWVWGQSNQHIMKENGHLFEVSWEKGQKTGFFIDQRENRLLLAKYSPGKKVLNTFCYSGGFSIYALKGGAREVHSVDISPSAIDFCKKNLEINGFNPSSHPCLVADVLPYLKNIPNDFNLIILDPPAFAKNIRSKHKAVQAYKRINSLAIKKIAKGGILFTFSCSQVIDRELFNHTITSAAMEAGRKVKIIHQLTQGPDHPINIYHQETAYLKGLVLYIE